MPALSSPRLGKNSKLYRNTGSYGTPSLSEFKNCKGVKVPNSFAEDDVTCRLTGGIEAIVTTIQKLGLQFQMFDDDGVDIVAIRTAYNAQTPIEFFVMNGVVTTTTARGVRMTCLVTKFDESQENDKANVFDVEIKPTWPDPAAVTAGAGSVAPVTGATTWTVA